MSESTTRKSANWQESLFQPRSVPAVWGDKFTAKDQQEVEHIITWLNEHKKTSTWLATLADVNRTTMQLILQGKYSGRVSAYTRKMLQALKHVEARKSVRETPFIPSTITKLVWAGCHRARKYKDFSVLTAEVGLGKTRALKEYCEEHDNTIMLEADPLMSPSALLDDLIEALSIESVASYMTREKRFKQIIERLKGSDILLILDEAETVNPKTLEHLRRIRDKAGIGIMLTGTPKLDMLIAPKGGHFDQIRSRVGYWPKPVRGITPADAKAVLTAAFDDQSELEDSTFKAFWHHCQGSMRMLVENLIPAVRDYGLQKHNLSADLVHAVARDVLSLTD